MTQFMPVVEVAKIIRGILKETFPETKFSVRLSRYSGGASVAVGWEDGPSDRRVDEKIGFLQGLDSDPMTDSSVPRGAFKWQGKLYSSGANYVQCHRHYSKGLTEKMLARVKARYGLFASGVTVNEHGVIASNPVADSEAFLFGGMYLSQLVWRELQSIEETVA